MAAADTAVDTAAAAGEVVVGEVVAGKDGGGSGTGTGDGDGDGADEMEM